MIRVAAVALVLVLGGGGVAEAQTSKPRIVVTPAGSPPPSDPHSRNEQMADYEPWCDGATSLIQCVDRIVWVDQELKQREALSKRTGRPDTANRGLSLMGCYNYCTLRHFPVETPQECRTSMATFRQASRSRPALLKTSIKGYLNRECRKT